MAKGGKKNLLIAPKSFPEDSKFKFKTNHHLRSQKRYPKLFRMLAKLYYL
jgi:hypothetical protein